MSMFYKTAIRNGSIDVDKLQDEAEKEKKLIQKIGKIYGLVNDISYKSFTSNYDYTNVNEEFESLKDKMYKFEEKLDTLLDYLGVYIEKTKPVESKLVVKKKEPGYL